MPVKDPKSLDPELQRDTESDEENPLEITVLSRGHEPKKIAVPIAARMAAERVSLQNTAKQDQSQSIDLLKKTPV